MVAKAANATNISAEGVVYFDGTATFSGVDGSTLGFVLTSTGTNSAPTFQTFSGTNLTWTAESGNFNAASNNGYICTAALTATLPASPSNGDLISLIDDTTSSVVIRANTGQVIRINGSASTSAGSATSTARGNTVTLVYNSSDTTWVALSFITTWTLA